MRKKTIGKLSFGPTVDITDPCYDRDVWCRMNKVSIKQGSYTCVVWSEDERVGIIGIYLDGKIPKQSAMKTIGEIGVDAGLAGFFFDKPDYDNAAWNNFCENLRNENVWVTEDGFFSSSGYGDGCYPVYSKQSKGENVALEIRFM